VLVLSLGSVAVACGESDETETATAATDPDTAPPTTVDRFSDEAATLMARSQNPALPDPGEPVDFDQAPFITRGLGPDGSSVRYYNFDVQPTAPAPIYVLFREGAPTPVEGQLNVVDVVPGDAGYNDFWRVTRVTVPADYVANSVTSLGAIATAGYPTEATETLVNCPVVPAGSTARLRGGEESMELTRGWYQGEVVHYFSFEEHALTGSSVPLASIYVAFNRNPDQEGGGPASGFVTEDGSDQTHNVLEVLPGSDGYSPLWSVNPYDNADFDGVVDLSSVMAANVLAEGVASVNCPVVDTGG
jgi:hypothetical protein